MRKMALVPVFIFAMVMLFYNPISAQTTTNLKFHAGVQCWETGLNPPLDPYGYLKFRISQLGQDSFTVNGRQIYYQDIIPWADAPVTGNAELIEDKWEMNLIATSFTGANICRASIDEDSLEGTFMCWTTRLRNSSNPGGEPSQHLDPGNQYWHENLIYKMKPIKCP